MARKEVNLLRDFSLGRRGTRIGLNINLNIKNQKKHPPGIMISDQCSVLTPSLLFSNMLFSFSKQEGEQSNSNLPPSPEIKVVSLHLSPSNSSFHPHFLSENQTPAIPSQLPLFEYQGQWRSRCRGGVGAVLHLWLQKKPKAIRSNDWFPNPPRCGAFSDSGGVCPSAASQTLTCC